MLHYYFLVSAGPRAQRLLSNHDAVQTKHLFLILILVAVAYPAFADVTADVLSRCRKSMGDHGSAMVKACVDRDLAAYDALAKNPTQDRPFVVRCEKQMLDYGWAMIKACADRDIAAASALAKYPTEHRLIIDRCQLQMGDYGTAMVKACADRDIKAEEELRRYPSR